MQPSRKPMPPHTDVAVAAGDKPANNDRALAKGRRAIHDIATGLRISGCTVDKAMTIYKTAVDRQFTRSRGDRRLTSYAASACLYIALRRDNQPYYLLFDFSEYLTVSVYVLASVLLMLCYLLSLNLHSSTFVHDPSLFIHRISDRLLGRRDPTVPRTALRIIARAERNWMKTSCRPSRLCCTALYIAAEAHGYDCSKSEVASAVQACEAGLSSFTTEEFLLMAGEDKGNNPSEQPSVLLLCRHKETSVPHFANALCRECYDLLVDISSEEDGSEGDDVGANDISEVEVDRYILNKEENRCKTIIWEQMNGDYLEEQAAKKQGYAYKTKNERNKISTVKRSMTSIPADEAAEEIVPPQAKKFRSSRLNYDALAELYGDEKKQMVEPDNDADGVEENNNVSDLEAAADANEEDGFEDGNGAEDGYFDDYNGYEDDGYGYEDGYEDYE